MNHLSELRTGVDKPLLLVTPVLSTMRYFLVLGLLLQSAILAMISRLIVVISSSRMVNLCLLCTAVLVLFHYFLPLSFLEYGAGSDSWVSLVKVRRDFQRSRHPVLVLQRKTCLLASIQLLRVLVILKLFLRFWPCFA